MQDFNPLADLEPAAYAPFRDPRDYILSWTDQIWIEKGLGRLGEHYADDIKVHTAYGETYDFDHVILNSVQKMSAFPNGGGGSGEDVVWEQRGPMGFISSHRVLKTGTNLGYWMYGAPTGKNWVSRTIAHCLVQERDGQVLIEAFALFVHYQLTVCPPIPDGDVAARASGRGRFNAFVTQVGKAMASGKRTLSPEEGAP